jgi:4-amino-4-deoxy-L-arabinose transferase-like glycosyltransferase
VAVSTLALAGIDVSWLERFRSGYPANWDESLYMAFSLENTHALRSQGLWSLFSTVVERPTHAPLVPLTTVPIHLLAGSGIDSSRLTGPVYFVLLVLATYALAKRVLSPAWAVVPALVLATAPVVTDWTREYHFAVPAAALFTAAIWAMLRSEGLDRRVWVVAAGILLGLTVLARTMTIAYLPGFALAAGAQVLARGEERKRRWLMLAASLALAAAVAAVWYAPNLASVGHYLGGAGYGAESARYGGGHPITTLAFWAQDPGRIAADLYLPLSLVLAVAVVLAAAFAWQRRGRNVPVRLRAWARTPAFALLLIVAEGYLALVSSSNVGSAFSLPWLPVLVILCVLAVTSIPHVGARRGVVVALLAVAAFNAVMKSGWFPSVMRPRSVSASQLGKLPIVDGSGTVQQAIQSAGYRVPSPAGRLPAMQRQWLPFGRKLAGWMIGYADARHRGTYALFATHDPVFGPTRLVLSGAAYFDRTIRAAALPPPLRADPANSCRSTLRRESNDFLVTAQRAPTEIPGCREAGVDASARALGFTPLRSFAMPDGRKLRVWWLDRG